MSGNCSSSRGLSLLFGVLACCLWLAGCDSIGSDEEMSEPPPQSGEDYTYSKDAEPVDLGEVSVTDKTDSKIVFNTSGSDVDIEEGEVILSNVPENEIETAPKFLRKVEEVQKEEGQVTVETSQAALVDAVKEASLDFSTSVGGSSKDGNSSKDGRETTWKVTSTAKGVKAEDCESVQLKDVDLTSSEDLTAGLTNGTISFCPDISGDIDIGTFSIEKFSTVASGELTYNTDISATASATVESSGSTELATFETYGVAGPVQYTMELSLVAGYEAQAGGTAEVTTGIESGGSLKLGARYQEESWTPVSDQGLSFNSRPVDWGRESGVTVKGYIRPEITVFLYETAGPSLFSGPYVEFVAERSEDLVKDYKYGAYGGLDGGVGYDIEILSVEVAEYNKTLFELRKEIAGKGPTNPAPNEPRSPTPSDEDTTDGTSPTLAWEASDPDNDDLTYDVYLGTSSSPPSEASDISSKSYEPGSLEKGTTYYWKVEVTDQDGATTEGPVWSFTTPSGGNDPPNEPNSPTPSDGERTSGTSPTLEWEVSDPDGDELTYDVYLGTSESPEKKESDLSSDSYDPGSLQSGTTYYWKVVATDQDGASTEGPVWSFKTSSSENQSPNEPSSPSPSDGATTDGTSPPLTWEASDPDGDDLSYDLYFGTSSSPPLETSDLSSKKYDPGALQNGTTYYWKVKATDPEGATTEGPVWSFATPSSSNGNQPSNSGLADAPWPRFGQNIRTIARSPTAGPTQGTVAWTFDAGSRVKAPSIGSDGTVYIGDNDGLHAVTADGTNKWTYSGRVSGGDDRDNVNVIPAIASNGTLYLASDSDYAHAVSSSGNRQWTTQVCSLCNIGGSPAVVSDGTIYLGTNGGQLYALNPDGSVQWTFDANGRVMAPAVASDGTVYIGAGTLSFDNSVESGHVYAVNPDGSKKWGYKTGGEVKGDPAIGPDGTVYVGALDGKIYALRPDGTTKWTYDTGGRVRSSPAVGSDGTIYVGSNDHYLYALNSDGTLKWRYHTGDNVTSSPAVGGNGRIYIGSNDGRVYSISSNGNVEWTLDTGTPVTSSPAIGENGRLYIGSGTKLYAIGK